MLGIVLAVIACLCWLLAAVNQSLFHQSSHDLGWWGLFAFGLAWLFGYYRENYPNGPRV